MNILSKFIVSQLIQKLEEEFISHAPDLQEAFIAEITLASNQIVDWINSKIRDNQNTVEGLKNEKSCYKII
jgi:hypothetical protein